ncbi:MAG TPA: transposase, partial [Candidatus Desulfovibrio intestinipullorum]|nr:transposase [Candidatus Desulfovibrio intestinipullorum]
MDAVKAHHRHDITDELWDKIASFFSNSTGKRGRPAGDNRRFFNAVIWVMRSGAPWRDLPPDYGNWNSIFV